MDVFGYVLRFSHLLPGEPQGGVGVVWDSVHLVLMVGAEFPVPLVPVMRRGAVGGVDTVLPLRVTLINVSSVVVNIRFSVGGVSRNIVVRGRLLLVFVEDAAAGVLVGQVWHAARTGGRDVVFLRPPAAPGPVVERLSGVVRIGRGCHAVILRA